MNDLRQSGQNQPIEKCKESEANNQVLEDLQSFDLKLSDDTLSSIPMPETAMGNVSNICTNSVFNNRAIIVLYFRRLYRKCKDSKVDR